MFATAARRRPHFRGGAIYPKRVRLRIVRCAPPEFDAENPRLLLYISVHYCTLCPMKAVSFTNFRKNASTYLDQVEKGAEVEILRHGKVVARLVPPGARGEPAWRKPGLKLAGKAPSLSQAIIEDRR